MPDLEDTLELYRSAPPSWFQRTYLVLVDGDPEPYFFLDPRSPADFFEPGTFTVERLP